MKNLAKISYTINYDDNYDYNVKSLNIKIFDNNLISRYTDKNIDEISVTNTKDGYLLTHKISDGYYNESEIVLQRLIGLNILNTATIGDLINFTTPIIYTKDSICNEIVKGEDEFTYNASDINHKLLQFSFSNDTVVVIHPVSRSIYEYKKRVRNSSYNFTSIKDESKHIITDKGTISEYYNDNCDKVKEYIYISNNGSINVVCMLDKSILKSEANLDLYYLSNNYKKYTFNDSEINSILESDDQIIDFLSIKDPVHNYALDLKDIDVIIDPLFPEESMKGNKISFSNLSVSDRNDEHIIMIDMILYHPGD